MNDKYELLEDDTVVAENGATLYRIRAKKTLVDLYASYGDIIVKKGELGGYIQSESNLDTTKTAWVCPDAQVFDNAVVADDSYVCGDAKCYGNAKILGYSVVAENARVFGNALLFSDWSSPDVRIGGHVKVCGNAKVFCCDELPDRAIVDGDAVIGEPIELEYSPWWEQHNTSGARDRSEIERPMDKDILRRVTVTTCVAVKKPSFDLHNGAEYILRDGKTGKVCFDPAGFNPVRYDSWGTMLAETNGLRDHEVVCEMPLENWMSRHHIPADVVDNPDAFVAILVARGISDAEWILEL